jgi:hypothetical protein
MVMVGEQSQPQEETTQPVTQPGQNDQVAEQTAEFRPEAEKPASKTYSQEEWDVREHAVTEARANSDKQVAQARKIVAEAALRQQINESEAQHVAWDRQAVEEGEITEAQVRQRQQSRLAGWKQEFNNRRQVAKAQADHQEMEVETQALARTLLAHKLAKDHGIAASLLLADQTLTSGEAMENKARSLNLDKREAEMKGSETFDSGQVGSRGVQIDSMSPEKKISWALAHPTKRR